MVLRCFNGNDNFICGPVQKNVVQLVKSTQVGILLLSSLPFCPLASNVTGMKCFLVPNFHTDQALLLPPINKVFKQSAHFEDWRLAALEWSFWIQ